MTQKLILSLVVIQLSTLPSAQTRPTIQGVWRVVEVATSFTNTKPQPGLYIFTAKHFSIMRVTSDDPRPQFNNPNNVTAAEALAVYGPLQAQAGTYEIVGGNLNLLSLVAKNPDVMSAGSKPDVYTFTLQGDHLTLVQRIARNQTLANPITLQLTRAE